MQFTAFINRVGHRIGPPAPNKLGGAMVAPGRPDEAERATLVVLGVLGECLGGEETEVLATRLPRELRGPLTMNGAHARYYSLEQFRERVAERGEVDLGAAAAHASAVMEVIAEAVGEEGLRYVRPLLPEGLVEPPPVAGRA